MGHIMEPPALALLVDFVSGDGKRSEKREQENIGIYSPSFLPAEWPPPKRKAPRVLPASLKAASPYDSLSWLPLSLSSPFRPFRPYF